MGEIDVVQIHWREYIICDIVKKSKILVFNSCINKKLIINNIIGRDI